MPSYSNKKELRFVISLGTGKFGSSDNNVITLQGYRATVDIDKAGGMMMGTLHAQIYGVSQSDMNSITTLQWKPQMFIINKIQVTAIDGDQETLVFSGDIINAWADYHGAPEVFLRIQARTAHFASLVPVPPRSFKGSVSASHILKQIANDMGFVFENNGVTTMLSNVYLPNTDLEQAKDVAKMAGCDLLIDDNIMSITPKNTPRQSIVTILSPMSGMIGYPTFDGVGVMIETLFNPAILFGGSVIVESSVDQAAGQWIVVSMAHHLESEKPGGAWFSTIRGNASGLAVIQ